MEHLHGIGSSGTLKCSTQYSNAKLQWIRPFCELAGCCPTSAFSGRGCSQIYLL
jgi:hypothetical protein